MMKKWLFTLISMLLMATSAMAACEDDSIFKIRTGAENGDAKYEYKLGNAFRYGLGVRKDEKKAIEWWRKSAEKGHAPAMVNIGIAYAEGRGGLKKSTDEALLWYVKAANNGSGHAKHLLANYYASYNVRSGWIYDQGQAQAKKLRQEVFKPLQMAGLTGDPDSQYAMGNAFHNGWGTAKNDEEAARWYRKAAEQCHVLAETALGMLYKSGEGVEKNDVAAVEWFGKAAILGNSTAQYMLAGAYITGQGIGQDMVKGYIWLNMAALDGLQQAAKEREAIAPTMRADQIMEANRLTNEWINGAAR